MTTASRTVLHRAVKTIPKSLHKTFAQKMQPYVKKVHKGDPPTKVVRLTLAQEAGTSGTTRRRNTRQRHTKRNTARIKYTPVVIFLIALALSMSSFAYVLGRRPRRADSERRTSRGKTYATAIQTLAGIVYNALNDCTHTNDDNMESQYQQALEEYYALHHKQKVLVSQYCETLGWTDKSYKEGWKRRFRHWPEYEQESGKHWVRGTDLGPVRPLQHSNKGVILDDNIDYRLAKKACMNLTGVMGPRSRRRAASAPARL